MSNFNWSKNWKKVLLVVAIAGGGVAANYHFNKAPEEKVSFTIYKKDIDEGKIKKVEVTTEFLGETLTVHLKDAAKKPYKVSAPHMDFDTAVALSVKGFDVSYPAKPIDYSKMPSHLLTALLIGYLGFMVFQLAPGGLSFGSSNKGSKTRFTDVAGAAEAKMALQEVVDYLNNPKSYREWGAKFPSGVILFGPPGNGKTLLARAVAGEANAGFLPVSASDFNSPFIGMSGMKIKRTFAKARAMAPCIVFIDEIDAIGGTRMSEGTAAAREMGSTLTQLLVQMDGFEENSGVIVIAATNRLDSLDPALLRSGRFDRHIQVHAPTLVERQEILRIHSEKIPVSGDFNYETIAKASIGMNGADLANIMNTAALMAKKEESKEVTTDHGLRARDRMIMGEERPAMKELLNVETRNVLAVHEASHAVVCRVMGHDPVTGVSIVPRSQSLGQTLMTPEADRILHSKEYLLAQLRILAAGRVGEELFANICTTGAENDIKRMTEIASDMVKRFGMSPLGMVRVTGDDFGNMCKLADNEILSMLYEAQVDARAILENNADVVRLMTTELLAHENLDTAAVEVIFEGLKDRTAQVRLSAFKGLGA